MPATSPRLIRASLDAWVVVATSILVWPLIFRGGYPFARDLVFTPHLPLRPETLGLGTSSPRAAPLDAIVGLLSVVVDGGALAKILVPGGLLLAGWGAHRLAGRLSWSARAAVAGFAVWNPFVIERLGLGQWALLYAYAAVFWVVHRLATQRDRPGEHLSAAAVAPGLAVASVTPTGAILVGGVSLALGLQRRHTRGNLWLLLVVAAAQLPWLVPALAGGSGGVSDPAGVAAFAARAERIGPAVLSLIGLGGLWDRLSVPGTRAGLLGYLTTLAVLCAVALVATRMRRRLPPRLFAVGVVSLVVASATSLPGGATVVAQLTRVVPGLGLLRDAQKWLVPFVVLAVLSVGLVVDAVVPRLRGIAPAFGVGAGLLGIGLPWLLLPDGATVVHRVVQPVTYPSGFRQAASLIDADPGLVMTLPWGLYREYPWATEYATYDPASRWFDAPVVTDDSLHVGATTVRGEDPQAARIGAVLAGPSATSEALAALGVRYIVVYPDVQPDPPLVGKLSQGPGVQRVVVSPALTLLHLPDASGSSAQPSEPSTWTRATVAVIDAGVFAGLVGLSVLPTWRRRRAPSVTLS